MKVIKAGKKPGDKKHRWTCKNCSAVVESTRSEGREICNPRGECAVIFNCPECNQENWINLDLF